VFRLWSLDANSEPCGGPEIRLRKATPPKLCQCSYRGLIETGGRDLNCVLNALAIGIRDDADLARHGSIIGEEKENNAHCSLSDTTGEGHQVGILPALISNLHLGTAPLLSELVADCSDNFRLLNSGEHEPAFP
jgi:hypothetical protein